MAEGDKNAILADFQACTGIQDIGAAFQHLEDTNWVLVDAVNRALAGAEQPAAPNEPIEVDPPSLSNGPVPVDAIAPEAAGPSPGHSSVAGSGHASVSFPPASQNDFPGNMMGPELSRAVLAGSSRGVSLAADLMAMGPSSQRNRLLDLNIEHRDRLIHLKVPDSETIGMVKTLLQAETGVPPCQQEVRGWQGNSHALPLDRTTLSDLNLPRENFLYLITPEIPAVNESSNQDGGDNEQKYQLTVIDQEHDRTYSLTFSANTTVTQVKRDVATVTSIPVFRQVWLGWPEGTQDDHQLSACNLPSGEPHILTVSQKPAGAVGNSMPTLTTNNHRENEEDDDDDFQDATEQMDDDDIFLHSEGPSRSGIQPLLPDDFGDDALAGIKFAEEFGSRYGQPCPTFFPGSLDDALAESCGKPVMNRKMLAVYLHHDSSVLTNVFCTQVLCTDAVLGMLNESFVTWGWDLTFTSNKQRLLKMISQHFGSVASASIRNFEMEKLPLVILIAKLRGNLEIFQMIHGNTTLDEFMTALLSAVESYQSQIGVERKGEEERIERDMMKQEQERAFQEAQIADQVRENKLKEAEEEARLQEMVEEAKRRSEAEAKEAEKRRQEEEMEQARLKLPEEPPADTTHKPVANIRFRTPKETLSRRFFGEDTLSTLMLYLVSQGYMQGQYKILSSWPRRDLSVLDPSSTLQELKLCPQETLTLEARHSEDSDTE